MSTTIEYQLISNNIERQLELTASRRSVKIQTEYYLDSYKKIRSIDDFINDTRLFTYAMEAFGLSELAFAKGYMRKILEEGASDPTALANRTNDPRIQEFARTFDFDLWGPDTMNRVAAGEDVVGRYVRQTLEEEAGSSDEGVRLALYFERAAPTIDNALEVLADQALRAVVLTALGLPKEFGSADIDKQAAAIAERIDFESLADPEELNRFLTRFTSLWEVENVTAADPVLNLFGVGSSSSPTISLDLALTFSQLRTGGN